jgi:rhamnosyltransferase
MQCSGRYIVYLTQDAVPVNACWLENLLKPFDDYPDVAGVYSRQIARSGASLLEVIDLEHQFPRKRFIKKWPNDVNLSRKQIWRMIHFSNSSSAYNRELLLKNPFQEQLEMAEDQEWVWRMLRSNFTFIYEPTSIVLHSHEHSLKEKYKRSFSLGRSFSAFLKPNMGKRSPLLEALAAIGHTLSDYREIVYCKASLTDKLKWIMLSPIHRALVHFAYQKGWNSATSVCNSEHFSTDVRL